MASERIAVLGAGQAGGWAALTLRAEGFTGDVVLLGEEPHLPYERPPLSKGVLAGTTDPEACNIAPADSYEQKKIRRLRERCIEIRAEQRELAFESGRTLAYDKLVIATGTKARRLGVEGASCRGIHYLRTREDAATLRESLLGAQRLLVIGGGWIGLEVAATARTLGLQVTVAESGAALCARSLEPQAARQLETMHRQRGVDIRLNSNVARFDGVTKIRHVVFADGEQLDVDCVVVGIGVTPNDELAREAGIATDNGILVDGFGKTSVDGIYAAGDVARHPNPFLGEHIRLETWEHAQNHGIHVAKSVLGTAALPYAEVPWVWSDQYDANIQIMGFLPDATDTKVLRGEPNSDSFTLAYLRNDRLWGAVSFNQGRDLKALRRLMQAGIALSADSLQLPVPQLMKLQAGSPPRPSTLM